MNCPVCDHTDLPKDAESCTHCGSDLGAFHAIQRVHKQRRNYRTTSVVLAALALLAIVYIAVIQSSSPQQETDDLESATMAISTDIATDAERSEVDKLESIIIVKDAEIANLKSEVAELEATMHSSFDDIKKKDHTEHVVKEGESLWSISEMYHGHGFKHLSIAGHNDLDNVDHIEVGDTIIIQH